MRDGSVGTWLHWGRLFRLSLAPSAVADAAAGILLGAGGWPLGPWGWLLAASACTYHGGMALNDWADRARDAELRPERPLPSGGVSSGAALTAALALLVVGPVLAWFASPAAGLCMGLVAACAAGYDLVLRGPFTGPLALAGCRAGNVAAAAVWSHGFAPPSWSASAAAVAIALYGLYVFWVSRLGTFEDVAAERDLGPLPARYARAAGVLLLLFPAAVWFAMPADFRQPARLLLALLITALAAWHVLRRSARPLRSSREVLPLMGACLRRLLILTAAASLVVPDPAAPWVAAAILAGYPASYLLRAAFPPS